MVRHFLDVPTAYIMYVAHMKGSSPSHFGKGALEAPSLVIWTLTAAGGVLRFRPKHRFLSLGYDDDDDEPIHSRR